LDFGIWTFGILILHKIMGIFLASGESMGFFCQNFEIKTISFYFYQWNA
jgi:hypothetical protein